MEPGKSRTPGMGRGLTTLPEVPCEEMRRHPFLRSVCYTEKRSLAPAVPPMSRTRQFVSWIEAATWMALILCLSGDSFAEPRTLDTLKFWVTVFHLPLSETSLALINLVVRKTGHFGEFFVLGLLLYRALSGGIGKFDLRTAGQVSALGAFCAFADELHQVFAPSRTPSIRDVALDFTGVVASQLWIFFRSEISSRVTSTENSTERSVGPGCKSEAPE